MPAHCAQSFASASSSNSIRPVFSTGTDNSCVMSAESKFFKAGNRLALKCRAHAFQRRDQVRATPYPVCHPGNDAAANSGRNYDMRAMVGLRHVGDQRQRIVILQFAGVLRICKVPPHGPVIAAGRRHFSRQGRPAVRSKAGDPRTIDSVQWRRQFHRWS